MLGASAAFADRAGAALGVRAFEVEGEQAFENLFVGEVGGPAVGSGDGLVEFAVREVEPGGSVGSASTGVG